MGTRTDAEIEQAIKDREVADQALREKRAKIAEQELKLRELLVVVDLLFKSVDKQGLYLGAGYHPKLSNDQQEGPLVKRLRELRNELVGSD